MTRFVGDAIAQRSGRTASTYTSKDLKKNMAKFLETGVHPDLERARRDASTSAGMVPLPDLDINRPFVFMDISIDNKPAGVFCRGAAAQLVRFAGLGLVCLHGCQCCTSSASMPQCVTVIILRQVQPISVVALLPQVGLSLSCLRTWLLQLPSTCRPGACQVPPGL